MDQVTFADVIQKSFIALSMGSADRITTLNIVTNVLMSFLVGMFIFYIYRKTFQGVLYQRSFNVSLVLASTVTSLVIMTISGNLILSLGMVGALSIVRFRTPVKDSLDLIFLFWSISVGIANGVGYYNIAIAGSAMIAIFLLLMNRHRGPEAAYLLVVRLSAPAVESDVTRLLAAEVDAFTLKSKSVSDASTELTFEVRLKSAETGFVDQLINEGGAIQATLVSFDQDYSAA